MAVKSKVVSVTTAPTRISSDGFADGVPGAAGVLKPAGGRVFVGGDGVTAATGYPVEDGEPYPWSTTSASDVVWAITATGSVNVNVNEIGVA
jgi:hypothetical protein